MFTGFFTFLPTSEQIVISANSIKQRVQTQSFVCFWVRMDSGQWVKPVQCYWINMWVSFLDPPDIRTCSAFDNLFCFTAFVSSTLTSMRERRWSVMSVRFHNTFRDSPNSRHLARVWNSGVYFQWPLTDCEYLPWQRPLKTFPIANEGGVNTVRWDHGKAHLAIK